MTTYLERRAMRELDRPRGSQRRFYLILGVLRALLAAVREWRGD